MARPQIDIDENQVRAWTLDGCSAGEIADMLGIDEKTVRNRCRHVLKMARAERRTKLRKAQTVAAIDGNVVMQIWLGKQELGQRDIVVTQTENLDDIDWDSLTDEELEQVENNNLRSAKIKQVLRKAQKKPGG